jgi:hypothetical protein
VELEGEGEIATPACPDETLPRSATKAVCVGEIGRFSSGRKRGTRGEGETAPPRVSQRNASAFRYESGLRRGNRKIFLREEARNSREGETATPRVSRQNASAFCYESGAPPRGLRRGNRKIFLREEARNSEGG